MLQAIAHAGLLPCKDGVADGLYGNSPACLDAVAAWGGVTMLVAMPAAQGKRHSGWPTMPCANILAGTALG